MTNAEFKAWFEGFLEGMEGTPNRKQWERIKKKVSEIDGTAIQKIYIDRYIDRWHPYYAPIWYGTIGGSAATVSSGQAAYAANSLTHNSTATAPWTPETTVSTLLHDEGMREAQALS